MGHLAWADAFVITADSVSMLSEACSTGYVRSACISGKSKSQNEKKKNPNIALNEIISVMTSYLLLQEACVCNRSRIVYMEVC